MKNPLIDKRNQLILFLGILLAVKMPQAGARFALWVLTGIIVAALSDILIRRIFYKQKITPNSAIITGFITAGIIDYNQPFFILSVFVLLAIISKHIIRYKSRHVFNPANFALFAAAFFRVPLTWAIESNIYFIIAFGLYMAYSIRKLPHVSGFLILFSALFMMQGINPFMLISWFFVFVMLIEPKTSGFGRLNGFIFGSIAGIAAFLVFRFVPRYDLFVLSLFAANAFIPLLEMLNKKNRAGLPTGR